MGKARGSNKRLGRRLTTALIRLVSVCECLFVLLVFPFAYLQLNIPIYAIGAALLVAAALCIVLMPLLYDVINSTKLLPSGKYHIPLALSTLTLSFIFSLFFSLNAASTLATKILLLFICLVVGFVSYLVYTYVAASIGSRLIAPTQAQKEKIAFSFVGICLACIIMAISLRVLPDSQYATAASCASIVVVLAGIVIHLATYKYMPRFIKLKSPKKRDAHLIFSRFFSPLLVVENRRTFLTQLLFMCGSFLVMLNTLNYISPFGGGRYEPIVIVFIFALSQSVVRVLLEKRQTQDKIKVLSLCLSLLFAILLLVLLILSLPDIVRALGFYAAALLFGTAFGLYGARMDIEIEEARIRSDSSVGIIVCIKNIVNVAALALSFLLVSVCAIFGVQRMLWASVGLYLALQMSAVVVSVAKKRYLTLQITEEDDV